MEIGILENYLKIEVLKIGILENYVKIEVLKPIFESKNEELKKWEHVAFGNDS